MDDILQIYIEETFTEELQGVIYSCFDLFDYFNYTPAYSGLVDIVSGPSITDGSQMQDAFINELHAKMDFIFEQHQIKANPETPLRFKMEISRALAQIQKLEDYTPVLLTLESNESTEVKFATIFADLTSYDESQILEHMQDINPNMLAVLKTYSYQQEEQNVQNSYYSSIRLAHHL
jgi:hypothetical protein